ncbi:MAG TPA: hypothetical protein VLB02_00105 [Candidatus Paceibacterota bacterium]|nr:hypothetical protein [Candidatus Paceibacterota bacterium]
MGKLVPYTPPATALVTTKKKPNGEELKNLVCIYKLEKEKQFYSSGKEVTKEMLYRIATLFAVLPYPGNVQSWEEMKRYYREAVGLTALRAALNKLTDSGRALLNESGEQPLFVNLWQLNVEQFDHASLVTEGAIKERVIALKEWLYIITLLQEQQTPAIRRLFLKEGVPEVLIWDKERVLYALLINQTLGLEQQKWVFTLEDIHRFSQEVQTPQWQVRMQAFLQEGSALFPARTLFAEHSAFLAADPLLQNMFSVARYVPLERDDKALMREATGYAQKKAVGSFYGETKLSETELLRLVGPYRSQLAEYCGLLKKKAQSIPEDNTPPY